MIEEIQLALPQYHIELFDEIVSTNTYLVQKAKTEPVGKTIALARLQTGGRGRMGRTFHSPKSAGLYMTMLLPLSDIQESEGLTMRVGVALYHALTEQYPSLSPTLKWVNDIYVKEKKLAGILVEGVTRCDGVFCAVIGIGVNLLKSAFPEELIDRVTSIEGELTEKPEPFSLVLPLTRKIEEWLSNPFSKVIEEYRNHSYLKGKSLYVMPHGKDMYIAEYVEIDESGALIIKTEGGEIQRLFTGDVSVKGC